MGGGGREGVREGEGPVAREDVGDVEALYGPVQVFAHLNVEGEGGGTFKSDNEILVASRGERVVEAEARLDTMSKTGGGGGEDVLLDAEDPFLPSCGTDESSDFWSRVD